MGIPEALRTSRRSGEGTMADFEPREIGGAEDALLARAEEYPRRPINRDPHFLAALDELDEAEGFSLIGACDESLEFRIVPDGFREMSISLKIVGPRRIPSKPAWSGCRGRTPLRRRRTLRSARSLRSLPGFEF